MRVVDANVLLYAVNRDAEDHDEARQWLDRALGGADRVGLSWIAMLAFVRLTTKIGLPPSPLSAEEATEQVLEYRGRSSVVELPGACPSAHVEASSR